ncbi:MAG: hypothetical protein WCP45_04735 [Verrucomicrobiota bacterium]
MKLTQYYGDLVTHSIPLVKDGAAFVPGDEWNLIFTAKRRSSDPDTAAIIQKTPAPASPSPVPLPPWR